MDAALRKAEKDFVETPTEESATRLVGELRRSGKDIQEAAESLLEATAKTLQELLKEAVKGVTLPTTVVLVKDEKLAELLHDYTYHETSKPIMLFQNTIGLTSEGLFLFEIANSTYRIAATGKIYQSGTIRSGPIWASAKADPATILGWGMKVFAYLEKKKKEDELARQVWKDQYDR